MKREYSVGDLIYDGSIYDGMNSERSDLPFYQKWMPKNKDSRILELCSGTGRLTIPLAEEGYDITGVDITPSMLEKARSKAAQKNLDLTFIEADIRNLKLPDYYDLIFIPFNSIHHLYSNKDLYDAFQVVKQHLKQGGLFILDCFNPDIRYITEAEKKKLEIASFTTEDYRNVVIQQTMKYDAATQINHIEWHYYINGKFDSIQKLDMRMYYPKELEAYLDWNGFEVVHKFGGFEEAKFQAQSEKQIFICK